jgi:pyruvate,orthophosphate dikinase
MTKAAKALQKASKYVYLFGNGKADGDGSMKALLGGKGANLAEMSRIGLPVPPGFTITTEVCSYYYAHKKPIRMTFRQDRAGIAQIRKSWAPSSRQEKMPCSSPGPAHAIPCRE